MMPKLARITPTASEIAKQAQRERIVTQILGALVMTIDFPSKPSREVVKRAIGWADLLMEELSEN